MKGIFVGTTPDLPATFDVDVSGLFARFWVLNLSGISFQSSVLTLLGGDGENYEAIMVTNYSDSTHTLLSVQGVASKIGSYPFEALCSHFRFVFTGGTPDIDITLIPQMRY